MTSTRMNVKELSKVKPENLDCIADSGSIVTLILTNVKRIAGLKENCQNWRVSPIPELLMALYRRGRTDYMRMMQVRDNASFGSEDVSGEDEAK